MLLTSRATRRVRIARKESRLEIELANEHELASTKEEKRRSNTHVHVYSIDIKGAVRGITFWQVPIELRAFQEPL